MACPPWGFGCCLFIFSDFYRGASAVGSCWRGGALITNDSANALSNASSRFHCLEPGVWSCRGSVVGGCGSCVRGVESSYLMSTHYVQHLGHAKKDTTEGPLPQRSRSPAEAAVAAVAAVPAVAVPLKKIGQFECSFWTPYADGFLPESGTDWGGSANTCSRPKPRYHRSYSEAQFPCFCEAQDSQWQRGCVIQALCTLVVVNEAYIWQS